MDCEKEDTQCITLFWTLFNETLQIVKQDTSYKFNPKGWVCDEAVPTGLLYGTYLVKKV